MPDKIKICHRLGLRGLRSCMLITPYLLSLWLSSGFGPILCARAVESHLVDRPKRPLFAVLTVKTMSASTRELAEQLEILAMLDQLYNNANQPTAQRQALLRQKIQETILESYFDAVSVQAEASREQLQLETLRESLISKRDRNIEVNNATNFIASGTLNTVGSVLGFSAKTPPFPGNLNQMLSGVVQATMSTYALKQNNGSKIRSPGTATILAELFGRPISDRTSYPESVWRFLHGTSPDAPGQSRLQILENNWIANKHLERHRSKRESLKIDLVSGVPQPHKLMTLDDLSDEITMIADISAVSELMTHHLRDLLRMIDSDVLE